MTENERREAARAFATKWLARGGNEDEDGRSYWLDLLQNVLEMDNVTDRVDFEKKVYVDGNKKRIDAYIPETKVLIEQKSIGKALDQKIHNSGDTDLTPYEQAKRYYDNLNSAERGRWLITCNFAQIWIYDMDNVNAKTVVPVSKIALNELPDKISQLDFLIRKDVQKIPHEVEVSVQAGNIVGKIYSALYQQYRDPSSPEALRSLNALCVRLVFCLFAEDADVFGGRAMFHDFLAGYDAAHTREALIDLFKILDTKEDARDPYLRDDLARFPYVNGGLFSDENIEIPRITDEIRTLIMVDASENFDWSAISPTIFGAVFESTLNPETRRSGGMHYTSVANIHKVIDPLFLDDLKLEFRQICDTKALPTRRTKLDDFHKKLSELQFLDPACGSGNFLTETYLSLRRLENDVLRAQNLTDKKNGYVGQMYLTGVDPIKVKITQFRGIEVNDFAVSVAKTALWIAENQTLKETENIIGYSIPFLPLTTNANIVEANALRIDWNDVAPAHTLNYIMGNPPFVGARLMSDAQKQDINLIFTGWKNAGNLDYVSCWYKKTADMMTGTSVRAALVSTNSVVQGEAVGNLWKPLFQENVHIDFGYRTFVWDSEANDKAHVHCVIIGFSKTPSSKAKRIFDGGEVHVAANINGYLLNADNIFVEGRKKPICDVPEIGMGNQPIDDGNYLFDKAEMDEFVAKEPRARNFFHPWYGAKEYIKGQSLFLWDRWYPR